MFNMDITDINIAYIAFNVIFQKDTFIMTGK